MTYYQKQTNFALFYINPIQERQYNSTSVIARFLNKLVELANRDKFQSEVQGKPTVDAEVTSDLCSACRVTIEDECFTFNNHHRWHPKCLMCAKCAKPQTAGYYDALFDADRGTVLCQQCKTPESQTGFSHVTKLEQYTFLLRVALIRLENLLHLKGTPAITPSTALFIFFRIQGEIIDHLSFLCLEHFSFLIIR